MNISREDIAGTEAKKRSDWVRRGWERIPAEERTRRTAKARKFGGPKFKTEITKLAEKLGISRKIASKLGTVELKRRLAAREQTGPKICPPKKPSTEIPVPDAFLEAQRTKRMMELAGVLRRRA
jgi:hypothetical protein